MVTRQVMDTCTDSDVRGDTFCGEKNLSRTESGGGEEMTQETFFDVYDLTPPPMPPHFDGSDIIEGFDLARLTYQIRRVYDAMADGNYRTLGELESITGDGQASISAQMRNLRKTRFGGHIINKRRRGLETSGCWEYALEVK